MLNVRVQIFPRQAVGRNPVPQHAAQLVQTFHDRDLVPHELQVIRRRQAAGAAADDGDPFARFRQALRRGDVLGIFTGKALETADVDGVVHHVAPAVRFAGMFTDKSARRGEGIVLADQLDRVFVPPVGNQGNITRNVHVGRAGHAAGDRLVLAAQAVPVFHVFLEIQAERRQAVQDHAARFVADGAVCRQVNGAGRPFQQDQVSFRPVAVQDLFQQVFHGSQSDAARYTLAAALAVAGLDHGQRRIDGAASARVGRQAAFHRRQHGFHRLKGFFRCIQFDVRHVPSLPLY